MQVGLSGLFGMLIVRLKSALKSLHNYLAM